MLDRGWSPTFCVGAAVMKSLAALATCTMGLELVGTLMHLGKTDWSIYVSLTGRDTFEERERHLTTFEKHYRRESP